MINNDEEENPKLLRFIVNEFVWDQERQCYWAQLFDKNTKSTMALSFHKDGKFIYAYINDINGKKDHGQFELDIPTEETQKEWDW